MLTIKKTTNIFSFVISVFSILFFCFFLGGVVFALSSNYSKVDNEALSVAEWNELANDFLAVSGGGDGVLSGILDANSNRVANVGTVADSSDSVSKGYIDGLTASAGGGDVFINWGRSDCPSGTDELYNGFGFGSKKDDDAGGVNNLCVENGTAGAFFSATFASELQPLVTGNWSPSFPTEIAIGKFIRCAVCYKSESNCYTKYGSNSCDGAYSVEYEGYLVGSLKTFSTFYTSRYRECINSNFDATDIASTFPTSSTADMYSTKIYDSLSLSDYDEGEFIRCAVCCN